MIAYYQFPWNFFTPPNFKSKSPIFFTYRNLASRFSKNAAIASCRSALSSSEEL